MTPGDITAGVVMPLSVVGYAPRKQSHITGDARFYERGALVLGFLCGGRPPERAFVNHTSLIIVSQERLLYGPEEYPATRLITCPTCLRLFREAMQHDANLNPQP